MLRWAIQRKLRWRLRGLITFDPEYATSFAARFENIKILISAHQYDEALRRLNGFLSNAKN